MAKKIAVAAVVTLGEDFWMVTKFDRPNSFGRTERLTHVCFETLFECSTFADERPGEGSKRFGDQLWFKEVATVLHNGPRVKEQSVVDGSVVEVKSRSGKSIGKFKVVLLRGYYPKAEAVDAKARKMMAISEASTKAESAAFRARGF